MRKGIMAWVSVALCLILIERCAGQVPPPEAVVDSAAARLAAQDWSGYAELMHPTALQEFAFYVMKITDIRLQIGGGGEEFDLLFGRPTLEELKTASPKVLFANFLRSSVKAVPEFAQALLQANPKRLGVVNEGEQLKHVVLRQTYRRGDVVAERVEVLTLEKDGNAWKMHFPPSIVTFIDELGWPKTDG